MAEYVCREFAREGMLNVTCLRLGDILWDAQEPQSASSALYPDDLIQVVEKSLNLEVAQNWTSTPSTWNLFHVQSSVPNQRFLTNTAQEVLGFSPVERR